MSKKLLVGSLCALAIAASLYFLVHKPTEKAEKAATDASEALGRRAAEEVASLVGNKGEIAVYSLELGEGQAPTFVAQMEIFAKTLKKHGVKVGVTKRLPGGLNALVLGPRLSAEAYIALLGQAPSAGAIVSFVGPPEVSPDELLKLQAGHPPLVIVDTFGVLKGPTLPSMVESKAVALAIVALNAQDAEKVKDQPALFDRYYRILRPPR